MSPTPATPRSASSPAHRIEELESLSQEIFDEAMAHRIWPGTRALAQLHLDQGQRVWLVTAAPVEIARIIAHRLGLTGAMGTVAEHVDGVYTGRLVGDLLHGPAKAEAVRALAAREGLDLARCSAYSDSYNDLPMLSLVGDAVRDQPRRAPARARPGQRLADPRLPHRPQGRARRSGRGRPGGGGERCGRRRRHGPRAARPRRLGRSLRPPRADVRRHARPTTGPAHPCGCAPFVEPVTFCYRSVPFAPGLPLRLADAPGVEHLGRYAHMARLGQDDLARGLTALRSAVLAVLAEERPALLAAHGILLTEATTPVGAEPGSPAGRRAPAGTATASWRRRRRSRRRSAPGSSPWSSWPGRATRRPSGSSTTTTTCRCTASSTTGPARRPSPRT